MTWETSKASIIVTWSKVKSKQTFRSDFDTNLELLLLFSSTKTVCCVSDTKKVSPWNLLHDIESVLVTLTDLLDQRVALLSTSSNIHLTCIVRPNFLIIVEYG